MKTETHLTKIGTNTMQEQITEQAHWQHQFLPQHIPNGQTGFNTCHIVNPTQLTYMVETVISQTTCTKELKN